MVIPYDPSISAELTKLWGPMVSKTTSEHGGSHRARELYCHPPPDTSVRIPNDANSLLYQLCKTKTKDRGNGWQWPTPTKFQLQQPPTIKAITPHLRRQSHPKSQHQLQPSELSYLEEIKVFTINTESNYHHP